METANNSVKRQVAIYREVGGCRLCDHRPEAALALDKLGPEGSVISWQVTLHINEVRRQVMCFLHVCKCTYIILKHQVILRRKEGY